MRPALGLLYCLISCLGPAAALAQADVLETIKRNPAEAKAMCRQFRTAKSKNKNFDPYSRKTTRQVVKDRKISMGDAEILITYVVGMHCPDVH
ncbi:hypothetical protein [Parasynechococcus sp.]|jgi:hypothetical protein|uniref:hypothetical protein n=1 Tax=Parasynechococcus sp. TaxID=3101203 RepID=UPI003704C413